MSEKPVHYAFLRPGQAWEGVALERLETGKDGMLELSHVPGQQTYLSDGFLLTPQPLDAGAGSQWLRVQVQAELPEGTSVGLDTFTADQADAVADPAAIAWQPALALDTLLLAGDERPGQPPKRRYLWLRVRLSSSTGRSTPRLVQVTADTGADSWLDYLPALYRRSDAPEHFLERWLAGLQGELTGLEDELEGMSRRIDPVTAPEDGLRWLAGWLAFDLPTRLSPEAWRALLPQAMQMHARRGTPGGLAEIVRLYTGARVQVREPFQERRIWQLGAGQLGQETGLAGQDPNGLIVPGEAGSSPDYTGLHGDYYSGVHFEALRRARLDRRVSFDWGDRSPFPADPFPVDNFAVRWTGQVLPEVSETFTFHVRSTDSVRLWVDGVLLIDAWVDDPRDNQMQGPPREHAGRIALEAGKWYPLRLEYAHKAGRAMVELGWSALSKVREIIPTDRLYPELDGGLASMKEAGELEVGQVLVGASGPQAESDFGKRIFADTAHLFTVLVPAGEARGPGGREAVRQVVEAEKPAHTDFHLCFQAPRFRVGFQARLGVDTWVAGKPEPTPLGEGALGAGMVLGGEDDPARLDGRKWVGKNARVG